jgi:hypothetical protein
LKHLPSDLESDKRLSGARSQRKQYSLFTRCDGFQNAIDRDVLILATLKVTSFVLEGHRLRSDLAMR